MRNNKRVMAFTTHRHTLEHHPYMISTLEVLILQEIQLAATGTRFLSHSLCNAVAFSSIHTPIIDGNPVLIPTRSHIPTYLMLAERPEWRQVAWAHAQYKSVSRSVEAEWLRT